MSQVRQFLIAFATLGAAQAVHAASLVDNFDSPEFNVDNAAADVAGQNGWTINDSTPDISFFVVWGYLGSAEGNHGAAVGAYLDAPVESQVELSKTYGDSLVNSLTTLKFSVTPSTAEYPGSDQFGWTYRGADTSSLLTISLEPNPAFSDRMEVVWYNGADVRTSTGFDLFYGSSYDLSVSFTGDGVDAGFSALITGAESLPFTGSLPGAGGATLNTFGANVSRDPAAVAYGDNFLIFDNLSIQAIPEPGTSLLALAGVLAGVFRRRR